jgi:hypothetical protein
MREGFFRPQNYGFFQMGGMIFGCFAKKNNYEKAFVLLPGSPDGVRKPFRPE